MPSDIKHHGHRTESDQTSTICRGIIRVITAPVYKLRLGRPSRLPSVFINFEMDPHLCSSSQSIHSVGSIKHILTLCIQYSLLNRLITEVIKLMNFIFSPIIPIVSISLAAPSLDLYTCRLSFGTLSSPTIRVWGVLLSSLYFMYHLLTPSIVFALSRLSPYLPAHTFLVSISLNPYHLTPLRCLLRCPLGHLCLFTTIRLSTIIHLLPPILLTRLPVTSSLSPHPSDAISDVFRMSALWVPCRSEVLVTVSHTNHPSTYKRLLCTCISASLHLKEGACPNKDSNFGTEHAQE